MINLPIDAYLPEIVEKFKAASNLILKASPGSGKTTRLPPALMKSGFKKIVVLVPKRIAAVSAADRIATENQWQLAAEVGYHVRFEPKFNAETQLIFMTEGVFIKKAQDEKFWNGIDVLIFDEFHERSALGDMALGLAVEKQILEEKIKIIVMSATLQSKNLETYLPNCVVVEIAAAPYALQLKYSTKPQRLVCDHDFYNSVVQTVEHAWNKGKKDVLVFLPGFSEMRKAQNSIQKKFPQIPIHILHGSIKISEQRDILKPHSERRIVLATDIAESSLTLPSVDAVIDSGLKKSASLETKIGFSQLSLQRISKFSAIQRAGRAARTSPGNCFRLWHESDERSMPDQIKPEILKADLTEEILTLKACGVDSLANFMWLDKPLPAAISDSVAKLKLWKLLNDSEEITDFGKHIHRLPLALDKAILFYHLAVAGFQSEASHLLACLETVDFTKVFADAGVPLESDLERLKADVNFIPQSAKIKAQLQALRLPVTESAGDFRKTLIAVFFAHFPEKVSQSKSELEGISSLGRGITFLPGLQARHCDYQILLAGYNSSDRTDVYFAVGFSKLEFLQYSSVNVQLQTEYSVDLEKRQLFKVQSKKVGRFLISESSRAGLTAVEEAAAWPAILQQQAATILLSHPHYQNFQRKKIFLTAKLALEFLPDAEFILLLSQDLSTAVNSYKAFLEYPLKNLLQLHISELNQSSLSQLPDTMVLPSGRTVEIDYVCEKAPLISAKIQDFYGMKDTPTLLAQKIPLTLQLLAPSLRPTQITQNLRLFWQVSYFEIRKELRARYPKQQWPDNPADYKLEKKKP